MDFSVSGFLIVNDNLFYNGRQTQSDLGYRIMNIITLEMHSNFEMFNLNINHQSMSKYYLLKSLV